MKTEKEVFCLKLKRKAKALDFPPWPGELGARLHENISEEAWSDWLKLQTMLINEKRLSIRDMEHRNYLAKQLEAWAFGGTYDQPAGYKPQAS